MVVQKLCVCNGKASDRKKPEYHTNTKNLLSQALSSTHQTWRVFLVVPHVPSDFGQVYEPFRNVQKPRPCERFLDQGSLASNAEPHLVSFGTSCRVILIADDPHADRSFQISSVIITDFEIFIDSSSALFIDSGIPVW